MVTSLTQVDIMQMRDQVFFEGTERNRRLSRYWLPASELLDSPLLIAAGGGCTACTMLSSTAELALMTGMDTATTTTASPSRNASDARRLVVPPPRGPSTAARSRSAS